MRTTNGTIPPFNVQADVDAQHALIVAQQVTDQAADNRSLQPMAEVAKAAVGASADAKCNSRCRLLERRTGRSLWGQGHLAARACEPRCEQSRRGHVVRPHKIYRLSQERHVPVPGGSDSGSQTTVAERLCGIRMGNRKCAEATR
jgi:hypothetical protein